MVSKKISILFMLALMLLCGCSKIEKTDDISAQQEPQKADTAWIEAYDTMETGVLIGLDENEKQITVKRIDSGEKLNFLYKGATNVTDKYNSLLTMTQVGLGELVNIYYNSEDMTARKIEKSPQAWEYTQLKDISYDRTECIISIGGTKYKYGASFTVISDNEEVDLLELNPMDEVTVKGYGKKICSVIITKGHGYIKLKNDEDFWGGWIEISNESVKPVTEGMMITASEGTHKLSIANNGHGGSKSIVVKRNEEVVVDVGDLKGEALKSGSIKFNIKPENAKLFINGDATDYSELVVLEYGKYKLTVKADGYADYSKVIIVGANFAEMDIDLTKEAESEKSTENKNTENKNTDNNKSTNDNKSTSDNKDENTGNNTNTNSDTDNNANTGHNLNNGENKEENKSQSDNTGNNNEKTVLDEETISQMIDALLDKTTSTNLNATE